MELSCWLPDDIVCFILSLLHPLYLNKCRVVCRQWYKLIKSERDLMAVWAKQEPWLLVCRELEHFEIWCFGSEVRFPFPASLVFDYQDCSWKQQVGSCQGLTLHLVETGLLVWAPLSGRSQIIPYPDIDLGEANSLAPVLWASADAHKCAYLVGYHCETGVCLYGKGWGFEETPSEIRELGRLTAPILSTNPDNPLSPRASCMRQYCINSVLGLDKWRQWPDDLGSKIWMFYTMLSDEKGRCYGVSYGTEDLPFCVSVWRIGEKQEVVRVGEISLYTDVDLCLGKNLDELQLQSMFCGDYIVIGAGGCGSPYPSRILALNTETLRWTTIHSGVDAHDDFRVEAMFQPGLLSLYNVTC